MEEEDESFIYSSLISWALVVYYSTTDLKSTHGIRCKRLPAIIPPWGGSRASIDADAATTDGGGRGGGLGGGMKRPRGGGGGRLLGGGGRRRGWMMAAGRRTDEKTAAGEKEAAAEADINRKRMCITT